jgi:hypothetical protein
MDPSPTICLWGIRPPVQGDGGIEEPARAIGIFPRLGHQRRSHRRAPSPRIELPPASATTAEATGAPSPRMEPPCLGQQRRRYDRAPPPRIDVPPASPSTAEDYTAASSTADRVSRSSHAETSVVAACIEARAVVPSTITTTVREAKKTRESSHGSRRCSDWGNPSTRIFV